VVRRGLSFAAIGVAAGLAASVLCGRLLGTQLYDTRPADPVTLLAATATLLIVALLAHLTPLARALRVNPAVTLRNE
jgi:putative ABC transport system permease protein